MNDAAGRHVRRGLNALAHPRGRRRHALLEHAATRIVAVLLVAAAFGPWIRDARVDALATYDALPREELLALLHEQAGSGAVAETIGLLFLVGLAFLGLVEAVAAVIRLWVIPRA